MKNKISKILLSAATLATGLGIAVPSQVFAATTFDGDDYVTLTRSISNVSNPVTNTFGYEITPGGDYSADISGAPTSSSIVFNGTTPGAGNTASATSTVSFASTTFNKAGDYWFTISETSSSDAVSFPTDNTTYQIVASVRYATNAGVPDPNNFVVKLISKGSNTWTSVASRTSFKISAQASGNTADVNRCFAYTLNIPTGNGVNAGDTFTASTTGADGCTNNPTTITAGTNATIYLKHNSVMTVGKNGAVTQVPVGSGFSVTLNQATENYTATLNGDPMTAGTPISVTGLVAEADPNFNTKNTANIDQHSDSEVPTGITTNVIIYTAILGIGVVGLAFAGKKIHSKK